MHGNVENVRYVNEMRRACGCLYSLWKWVSKPIIRSYVLAQCAVEVKGLSEYQGCSKSSEFVMTSAKSTILTNDEQRDEDNDGEDENQTVLDNLRVTY